MIFFIAALLIAATVASVFITIADDFSSDLEDEAERMRQEVRSHLVMINDPGNVPYENSTGNVTFYLMNVGIGDLSMNGGNCCCCRTCQVNFRFLATHATLKVSVRCAKASLFWSQASLMRAPKWYGAPRPPNKIRPSTVRDR